MHWLVPLHWMITVDSPSLPPSSVLTILNTAPGVKGLEREYFENTDVLCLNETEVCTKPPQT